MAMSENGLQVSYWLPMTELVVSAVRRDLVRTGDNGSHLEPAVDVTVAPGVVADPRSRQRLAVEASFLEKVDLRLTFDDGGFLRAVNSAGGRDLSPVLSVVGKVVGLAPELGGEE